MTQGSFALTSLSHVRNTVRGTGSGPVVRRGRPQWETVMLGTVACHSRRLLPAILHRTWRGSIRTEKTPFGPRTRKLHRGIHCGQDEDGDHARCVAQALSFHVLGTTRRETDGGGCDRKVMMEMGDTAEGLQSCRLVGEQDLDAAEGGYKGYYQRLIGRSSIFIRHP